MVLNTIEWVNNEKHFFFVNYGNFFLALLFMPFLLIAGSPLSSLIARVLLYITRAFFHCPIVSDGKTIKSIAEDLNVITYSIPHH